MDEKRDFPVCPLIFDKYHYCDDPDACECCIFRDCKSVEDCKKAYDEWQEECNNL